MNQKLFDAITNIDPKFIEEAAAFSPAAKRRPSRTAVVSAIAAAALAVAIVPAAVLLSKTASAPATPPTVDTPTTPEETPPGGEQGSPPVDPPETDEPPMAGAPMSLGETRTLPSGSEIAYRAKTDHSLTIFLKKADTSPVYLRLAGSNGSAMYYASTNPRYEGMGTRIDAFTITVNGKEGSFPSAHGEYEIVIDYAPLKAVCHSLGELYTTLGAFFL